MGVRTRGSCSVSLCLGPLNILPSNFPALSSTPNPPSPPASRAVFPKQNLLIFLPWPGVAITSTSHPKGKGRANTLGFPETFSSWPHILNQALFLLSSGSTDCFSSPTVPRLLWASQFLHALTPLPETLPLHPALSLQPQFNLSPLELE